VTGITSVDLRLTVNDRFFSQSGNFTILFTLDAVSELGATSDYDQLTFDPGGPTRIVTATTSGPVPEPAAYPTDFAASASFTEVNLSWTDSADAAGYLVLISDTNSFMPPLDGTAPDDDLELVDGSEVSVDVAFDSGSSIAELNDIDNFTTQTITFPASSSDGDQLSAVATQTILWKKLRRQRYSISST
jgi:hypothetical protein